MFPNQAIHPSRQYPPDNGSQDVDPATATEEQTKQIQQISAEVDEMDALDVQSDR